MGSSTHRPVSRGPNTPGCLLFKRPQLANTERVHLTRRVWMGSSTHRPVSRSPNTPGCLLFMRSQLTNTERVHLTTQSLDGKGDDDGHQDSRPPKRSPRTSQSPVNDKNSGKVWEDDYNYSYDFQESSDSEDEDESKQDKGQIIITIKAFYVCLQLCGCLLFMHPQLTNIERVHLTSESLDGMVDKNSSQDCQPQRRSPTTSQSPINDKNSGKVWEDDYNYSYDFQESSDSEDEDESKQDKGQTMITIKAFYVRLQQYTGSKNRSRAAHIDL